MTKKLNSLTILIIITIVMVLLMLVTIQRPNDINNDYSLLFPELFEQLNGVDTITFNSSQDKFTIYRQGEDWLIKERWSYPADFNLVKRALIDLSESKILERKTDNPDQYSILGVEGANEGGASLEVVLSEGGQQIAGIILGNERELGQTMGPRQFYLRRVDEDRTWLAEGYLNINPLMLNWIKSEVINIARERVKQVDIIQPNGNSATIINLGQKDKFGTPESREKTIFKYEQLGYDIAGSLFQLRMEDVQPTTDFTRGDAEIVTTEFTTYDGLKVITKTSFNNEDGFYYTTMAAEYDAAVITPPPEDIQKLNVLKTPEQVQQEVATLNQQLTSWVYRFSGFVGTNLMRAKADIVTESGMAIPMPADITGYGQ